jgi:RES domain
VTLPSPVAVSVEWPAAYHIIPSQYPPVGVFEAIYDSAEELEIAYALESLTNDRLIAEAGEISAVPRDEWVSGPGATPLMAAFTHLGKRSRFTAGSYGVYYAANSEQAAITETAHHKAQFLSATNEPDMELTMRVYTCRVLQPLLDIRDAAFEALHNPDSYAESQAFAETQRATDAWGLLYRSVRHHSAQCIAVFRPTALSIPNQTRHLRYVWSGKLQAFTDYFEIRAL